MNIIDKDIAIGSTRYSILQADVAGEGKKGDTIMTRGGNNSISAKVSLHLQNKSASIKVQQPVATPGLNGLTLPPFEYTFYFKKND